jgi:hypothetical protein
MSVRRPVEFAPKREFGTVWKWTALVVFFAVLYFFESDNAASPAQFRMTGVGWHATVVGLAAWASFFPGVMIAAIVNLALDLLDA